MSIHSLRRQLSAFASPSALNLLGRPCDVLRRGQSSSSEPFPTLRCFGSVMFGGHVCGRRSSQRRAIDVAKEEVTMTKKAQALAVALFVTAIAPPATAQTAASGNSPTDQTFVSQAMPGDWRTSKLVGTSIYGPNDESIGKVNDVVIDGSGATKQWLSESAAFSGWGKRTSDYHSATSNGATRLSRIRSLPSTATLPGTPGTSPKSTAADAVAAMRPAPIAVPASRPATVYDYPDHGTVTLTKDQLKSAPDFHYASEKKSVGG
jgi:hypothetical protein